MTRVILAIVKNAAAEGRSASFITPESRAAVARLVRAGTLKITSRGKYRGHTEIFATFAEKSASD